MNDLDRIRELNESLHTIALEESRSSEIDVIMQKAASASAEAIGCESSLIVVLEKDRWIVQCVYRLPPETVGTVFSHEELSIARLVEQAPKSVPITNTENDARMGGLVKHLGIRSLLAVPLLIQHEVVGIILLNYHSRPSAFTDDEISFADSCGVYLSLALRNARLNMQRRDVLDALRESEERFRGAFASALFGMLLTDTDGSILQVNRSLCTMLGYSEPELLKKSFFDLTHPDDLEASRNLVWYLTEGGEQSGVLEKRYLHRDGRVVWVVLSVSVIRNPRGKPLYFVTQVQDVTDRKQSEEALRRAAHTGSRLQEVMLALTGSRTFEEALKQLLDAALDLTEMEAGAVYLVENGIAVLQHHRGAPEPFVREVERVPMDSPVVQATLKQKDLLDLVEWTDDHRVPFKKHGMRHAFSIPLRVQGETYGFLNVGSIRPEKPSQVAVQTLTILATETESMLYRLLIERALRESEERFRSAFVNAAFGMSLISPEGRILQANRALCQTLGYSEQELLELSFRDLTHPDDREASLRLLDDLIKGRREYDWLERRYVHRDGHYLWAVLSIATIRDSQGSPLYFVCQMQDVTSRKKAEEALRESQAKLSAILQNTPAAVYLLDRENRFMHVNPRFADLFGIQEDQVLGRSIHDLFPHETAETLAANNRRVMQGRTPLEFDEMIPRPDGIHTFASVKSPLLNAEGQVYGVVGISTDISERRKIVDEMRHMANHDALTGLPNRRFFLDIIELEAAQARRNGKKLAILFMDLDRFKEVNDTFGHDAGDALLREVAARLKSTIRTSDTIARMGGDEFNIILSDIDDSDNTMVSIRKIMESFRRPFRIAGQELHVTTSVGISIYPDDSDKIDTLFRYADIALYEAKNLGKNSYYFYDPAINLRSVERIRLESSLRQSLERGELEVFYQPQIDIRSRRIVCAEALVRWHHPDLGLLYPNRFIHAAEDTGFITAIDEFVLRSACTQIRTWLDAGLAPACVTVNLSAREFQTADLVNRILRILLQTDAPAECLDVEITESLAMSNIERTISRLTELGDLGVHASIDDFGAGYSSLNYLKRLPIQKLKIDQSFVRDIATDAGDQAIISAVTSMAHSMKIKVLAEGVETEEQMAFLNAARCDEAQGFLISRPLPAQTFSRLMEAAK